MFTLTFGIGSRKTVTADDLHTAVILADALSAKGWLAVQVTTQDGDTVPWRTLTSADARAHDNGSHTVNRGAW